jgi:hypothetical protein
MYNKSKDQIYQNTANMLKNASSYREVLVPVSEVAIQFAELLNEVKKNANSQCNEKENGFEAPAEKKNKGGRKPKGD